MDRSSDLTLNAVTAVKGLVGILFRVAKSQAADHEIDEFMIAPRSRPR